MKNLISRVLTDLAAGALAITTVAAMASPARAATETYTTHGAAVSIIGTDVSFDIESNAAFTCEQLGMTGDGPVSSGCTSGTGDVTVEPFGAWEFVITGPEVGSVSPAAIRDMALSVDLSGCSFDIAGGLSGVYDSATGVFTATRSTLVVTSNPTGFLCPILGIAQGQPVSSSGNWAVTG